MQMSQHGYSRKELLAGGFKKRSVEAVNGRPVAALKSAGYACKELRGIGFELAALKKGGFDCMALAEVSSVGRFSREEGSPVCPQAGFDCMALAEVSSVGRFSREEGSPVCPQAGFDCMALAEVGHSAAALQGFRLPSYVPTRLRTPSLPPSLTLSGGLLGGGPQGCRLQCGRAQGEYLPGEAGPRCRLFS